jgi:hypothetical protein
LNCFARFHPDPGGKQATCPDCATQWRISWVEPGMAKIRGPVWDKTPGTGGTATESS